MTIRTLVEDLSRTWAAAWIGMRLAEIGLALQDVGATIAKAGLSLSGKRLDALGLGRRWAKEEERAFLLSQIFRDKMGGGD